MARRQIGRASLLGATAAVLAVVVLAGAVVGAMALNQITPPGPDPAVLPPPPTSTSGSAGLGAVKSVAVGMAVLGDSYALGTGANGEHGWPERLAADLCWTISGSSIQGGTGFSFVDPEATPGSTVFSTRTAAIGAAKPQVVLVQGGTNDEPSTIRQVIDGAAATFKALKGAVGPAVPIIAIGPVAAPNKSAQSLAHVSTAIAYAAAGYGVGFVDPIVEHWLVDRRFWSPDGFHPNADGYAEYAKRLSDDLRRRGGEKSCGAAQ